MKEINVKEWLKKYPNKCAIVKMHEDGETATLLEQSSLRGKEQFRNYKEMVYGEDESFKLIP